MVRCLVAYLALFALTVALQWANGAYANECGTHSDEACHFVSGLMVHDFL